ncbi:RHS repeat-associated core domain-containing protein [Streptomyces sp. SBT349]|uniref:TreTu family toxin n=1 Tax=Streptomyces sp. SBT349 TaxID=1580539 RepID=UPI001F43933D|nr:RHS repeat-associated core domain-containing protein [Streptomyces sp. SBT349]
MTLRLLRTAATGGAAVDLTHTLTGKPATFDFSSRGAAVARGTNFYERGTQRLASTSVQRWLQDENDRDETYAYDDAGNVLSIADVSRTGTDVQCFQYDHVRRLTEAWSQAPRTCASEPSDAAVGGPAPYWHSYSYDLAGNRLTETLHEQDTERAYDYPEPGAARPNAVTSVTQRTPDVTSLEQYGYDEAGNTASRQLGGDEQELSWDAEGRLASVEEADGSVTEYLYDADGNRLISRSESGTTLYLGSTEVTQATGSTTAEATRYVDLGGGHMAVIADDGSVSFTLADHHGTGQLAIDATSLTISQRRTAPFGQIRGQQPESWPGSRGFVGGIADGTGLTHLGAREYDPALGRFVSPDPVLVTADPQQLNAYQYGGNSPVTVADPLGTMLRECWSGQYTCSHNSQGDVTDVDYGKNYGRQTGASGGTPAPRWVGEQQSNSRSCRNDPGCSGTAAQQMLQAQNDRRAEYLAAVRLAEQMAAAAAAQQNQSWWQTGLSIAADVTGISDGWARITQGDAMACAMTVLTIATGGSGRTAALALRYGDDIIGAARQAENTMGSCARHSFLSGTEVLMADGTRRDIDDLEVGDEILATDPETGETKPRRVVATIITDSDKEYTRVSVTGADGDESEIIATAHHPFRDEATDTWTNATDLTPGAQFRTPDGTTTEVTAALTYNDTARTYDLTVEELHTYSVHAGATPVLVHDSNCTVGRWMSEDEYRAMGDTGQVQAGRGGASTYVASPANSDAYRRQAAPGTIYAEFDLPCSCLKPAGEPGWAQIPGPRHPLYSRLNARNGLPPPEIACFRKYKDCR